MSSNEKYIRYIGARDGQFIINKYKLTTKSYTRVDSNIVLPNKKNIIDYLTNLKKNGRDLFHIVDAIPKEISKLAFNASDNQLLKNQIKEKEAKIKELEKKMVQPKDNEDLQKQIKEKEAKIKELEKKISDSLNKPKTK
jgi:septal ring factor EnvC (AmiA/AmiB activator)